MSGRAALALMLAGIALSIGSCAPLGYGVYTLLFAEPAYQLDLDRNAPVATGRAALIPLRRYKVSLRAEIESSSVQEEFEGAEVKYRVRYRIPVDFTLRDQAGNVLAEGGNRLAWDSMSFWRESEQANDSRSGRLTARQTLATISAPASGQVVTEIRVGIDQDYGALARRSAVYFYDAQQNTWRYVAVGVVVLAGGVIAAIVGFVFVLTAAASGNANPAPYTQSGEKSIVDLAKPDEPLSRKRASWIHFSGFAGYLVPIGSIIAPIVLWMMWRDEDPVVEQAGREAVNFQLSVLIYALLCIPLMFILIGFLVLIGVIIYQFAYMIVAGISASQGKAFRYPLIIRFIK